MEMKRPPLSPIATTLLLRCARMVDASVDVLLEEFEPNLKTEKENSSRKLVEFCCSKTVGSFCCDLEEKIIDGSFSRFTFDMMLAWESPSSVDEQCYSEGLAKEKEDREEALRRNGGRIDDDISLFYSDLLPLLVNEEGSVGEDAFVWMVSLFPLAADVVNARFTFEALTAPTAGRLHFPAYDRFLKEMDKCIKYLQKQQTPTGMELAEDEFILHVEGTAKTQRVVRHIGMTSWPGRLTLTNKALYFEASGALSYENALKIDLSRSVLGHRLSTTSTGPWGVPLFDKAITYESEQQTEPVVLEFPEMTSSTRRNHWLTLVKEIILLHDFISKYNIKSPSKSWEIHARTIFGILRLHAAREMLRLSPPTPTNFLIFSLLDELPKGDYVLEDLSNSLKAIDGIHPSSATSVLKGLKMSCPIDSTMEIEEVLEKQSSEKADSLASLELSINQVREEAKEASIAKATIEELKDEGITDSCLVLMELLNLLKKALPWFEGILAWERPSITIGVLAMALLVTYKEWFGYALATVLMSVVGFMLWARRKSLRDEYIEIPVPISPDQMIMKNLALVKHTLDKLRAVLQTTNITALKIQSILVSRAPKHANLVMWVASGIAAVLMIVQLKFILMGMIIYLFCIYNTTNRIRKSIPSDKSDRRLKEWWDSIPVAPVHIIRNT
ncbi:hypothetical protein J5N97_010830 [Dioscorea zingiberensis]|uniref:Uncharacterized protein n=1 Tax=Dioscorea zingiberensis TaxID=325984 RepID=A0A9D5HMS2_9LILI|nr:hypothetical protein J5N97_010830 [Dioscorea zingiberensis]